MATSYSKYTFDDLENLGIEVNKKHFLHDFEPIEPSDWLKKTLEINLQLPLASEKAKCELIITPVLSEMVEINQKRFTYFSGYNFEVDKSLGLKGRCDYMLSLNPTSVRISAPIFSIVEGKNDNLDIGVPQCVAEMYAAQLFNAKHNQHLKTVFGAVSFGLAWQFLKLSEKEALLDTEIYYISDLPRLLGALQSIIKISGVK
jgi:hypothetical protein